MNGIHFKDNNPTVDGAFSRAYTPPYKIILELKRSTFVGGGSYMFWFKKEYRTVQSHIVSFYAKNMLDALQAFDANEVRKMTIEFD